MLPIRTILHPTDFSTGSAMALRLACSLARDYGARLIILHVVEPPMTIATDGLLLPPSARDLKRCRDELEQLQPGHAEAEVEHHLVSGDAAAEILRVAADTKCDVIVMGTHGRTGLGRLLMGSVAEQIVRKAPCPTLTVKAPPRAVRTAEESLTAVAAAV